MKIEQVIALHLFSNKEVTLQGIGTFRLDPSIALPSDIEKDVVLPENAISFEYNPKATEDASLIDSIVKHTTKIKPLASADLDSFLILGRQFLNIGKPFIIEKLGTLDKAQAGELIFIPGQFVTPKIEAPKALKENENEESSGLFNDYNRKPETNNKKTFAIIAIIIIAGLLGWAFYYFMFSKEQVVKENIAMEQEAATIPVLQKTDTMSNAISQPAEKERSTANDTSFNIIIRQTNNKQEALLYLKRLTLWGHHVVMHTADSLNFKIGEVINLPLADTARVKDSLSRFYKRQVYVELK
ncbi:MAG: hypothetical protein ABIN97_17945 [Ginsengibacter sp.]